MVVVYANIIDVIGRRLYAGNIVWIREYVQNAIDANAKTVSIKVNDNDLTIEDDGNGMNLEEINNQLFSLGGSVKTQEQIGQFGIGAYAGTGICDGLSIRTRKDNGSIYLVKLDMKRYNEMISKNRFTLFDEVIKEIFEISKDEKNPDDKPSFTYVKFANVLRDTIVLITEEDGKRVKGVLEDYVPLEIDESFPFKEDIEKFLNFENPGSLGKTVKITLEINEKRIPIKKYVNKNYDFLPVLIKEDINDSRGNLIAKTWALYSNEGKSLSEEASLILRFKGVAVGGHDAITKFGIRDTKRFMGEIVVMNLDLELNTDRNWFVETPVFEDFRRQVKTILKQLYNIANFDSSLGNGLIRQSENLKNLKEKIKTEKSRGNKFNAVLLEVKTNELESRVNKKVEDLKSKKIEKEEESNDTNKGTESYDQVVAVLAERAITEVNKIISETPVNEPKTSEKEWNHIAYVRTLLEKYVVEEELVNIASHKNSKDTLNNAFTLIETKLKEKISMNPNLSKDADFWTLVTKFQNECNPPPFVDEKDINSYKDAFLRFMTGAYGLFRNPASHTFVEHYKDERYNIQFLILGDILLSLIDAWSHEDPKI
jgi:hypothetical protein